MRTPATQFIKPQGFIKLSAINQKTQTRAKLG